MLTVMTISDIRKLDPCYDPVTGQDVDGYDVHPGGFLSEDWEGTALDILNVTNCPAQDRLFVVHNTGWIPDKELRLFAVWCAREALTLVDNPDPRSVAACDVAERYANGNASDAELAATRAAANYAAWDAAWAATWAAANDAANDAARAAAWAAFVDKAIEYLIGMLEELQ